MSLEVCALLLSLEETMEHLLCASAKENVAPFMDSLNGLVSNSKGYHINPSVSDLAWRGSGRLPLWGDPPTDLQDTDWGSPGGKAVGWGLR